MRAIVLLMIVGLAAPARADEVQPAFEDLEEGVTPLETYKLNALGLVSHEIRGGYPCLLGCPGDWWRPVRGKFRGDLRYEDFFRKLGRPDLARKHRAQRAVSGVFFWGGAAVFVGGGVLLFTGVRDGGFPFRAKLGAGMMLGGLVENGIGGVIQPPLVSEDVALGLVAEYNRRLRVYLGVGGEQHALGLTLRGPW